MLESPILKVARKSKWLGHGYYSVYLTFTSDELCFTMKDSYIINGYWRGTSNINKVMDSEADFIPSSITINTTGKSLKVPTQEDLKQIENNAKSEFQQVSKVTLQENVTSYTLPYYDDQYYPYYSRLYTVKVVTGDNCTVWTQDGNVSLSTGLNFIQCNKLVSLGDIFDNEYWEVCITDAAGNSQKKVIKWEARFGDYLLYINSDTSISQGTEIEFFGANKKN